MEELVAQVVRADEAVKELSMMLDLHHSVRHQNAIPWNKVKPSSYTQLFSLS